MTARTMAWRILQVVLLAAVAWGLYRVVAADIEGVGLAELLRWRPAAAPLAASFVLLLGVYVAHAAMWRKILADLHVAAPDARTTIRLYFLASLGRYIPGRLWQLAGMAVLANQAGIPPGRAAGALILGNVAFLTTGLLFLGLTLPGLVTGGAVWIAAAVLLCAAVAVWAFMTAPAARPARAAFLGLTGSGRAAERLSAAFSLADRIRPHQALTWATAYALTWVVLAAAFTLFAAAFAPGSHAAARHLGGTVAASYLLGFVAIFAPAGLLVRELTMTALLAEVMPPPAALVVAVASRIWFTAAELLPLALVPVLPRNSE